MAQAPRTPAPAAPVAPAEATGEALRVIGGRRSHDVLREVLAARAPCRVLDVPAGSGVLSRYMHELGYEVHAADIDPGNFELRGLPFERADLNRALPFADGSFDAVVCANGLHRLFHPAAAIREFHRVLRPGGRLHLTFNHYASLDRRLRFLLLGSLDRNLNAPEYDQSIDEPEAHVRHALLWPQVGHLLEAAGFQLSALRAANVKRSQRALLPLAWLLRAASLLVPARTRAANRVAETNGPGLLPGGKYLYAEAVRC